MPDRTSHVASFVVWQKRMPLSFKQANVGIVANNYIQVAVGTDLLEKSDVARMKPIIAAGHDDLFAARCPAQLGWLRKTLKLARAHDLVFQTFLRTKIMPGGIFRRLLIYP